jgi:hypothetical protein
MISSTPPKPPSAISNPAARDLGAVVKVRIMKNVMNPKIVKNLLRPKIRVCMNLSSF